jgi:sec-independent protein translocase protein TatA
MFGIGTSELLIILGIAVLLFGGRRLPEMGSGMGRASMNFWGGISGREGFEVAPGWEGVGEG